MMRYILISEVVWWCLSFLLALALVYPYYPDLIVETPFLIPNIIMIVLMFQCLRHIFFFRQSLLGNSGWLLYFIPLTIVPLFIYVVRQFNHMAVFLMIHDGYIRFLIYYPLRKKASWQT